MLNSEGFFFVQSWLGIDDKFAGTASLISINFAVEDDLFVKAGMLNGGLYIIWLEKILARKRRKKSLKLLTA